MTSGTNSISNSVSRSPQNAPSMARSLLWKDYRQLLPFWLTAIVTSVVVLMLMPWGPQDLQIGPAMVGLCGLLGITVGLVLYTFDYDQQTTRFVNWLPQNLNQASRLKLGMGFAAVVLGWGVLALFYLWSTYRWSDLYGWNPQVGGFAELNQWIELSLYSSVWCWLTTILVSRFLRSSLETSIVSVVAVTLLMLAANRIGVWLELAKSFPFGVNVGRELVSSRWFHCLGLLLLFSTAVWSLWQGDRVNVLKSTSKTSSRQRWLNLVPVALVNSSTWSFSWLSMRQSGLWIAVLMVSVIAGYLVVLAIGPSEMRLGDLATHMAKPLINLCVVFVLTTLCSVAVFWPDQVQKSFPFAIQHHASPLQFWGTRMVIWTFAILIIAAFAVGFNQWLLSDTDKQFMASQTHYVDRFDYSGIRFIDNLIYELLLRNLFQVPLILLSILALGQFLSLLFANGMILLLLQMVLASLSVTWSLYVIDHNEPTWQFVLPGTLACLVGGYWLTRLRLSGRFSLARATGLTVAVALIWTGQFLGYLCHRQFEYSIPTFAASFRENYRNGDALWNLPANGELQDGLRRAYMKQKFQVPLLSGPHVEMEYRDPNSKSRISEIPALWKALLPNWRENSATRKAVKELFRESPVVPSFEGRKVYEWNDLTMAHAIDIAIEFESHLEQNRLAEAWECLRVLLNLEASRLSLSNSSILRYAEPAVLRWSEHPAQTTDLLSDAMPMLITLGKKEVAPYLLFQEIRDQLKEFESRTFALLLWSENIRDLRTDLIDIAVANRLYLNVSKRRWYMHEFASNFESYYFQAENLFLYRSSTRTGFEPIEFDYVGAGQRIWSVLNESRYRESRVTGYQTTQRIKADNYQYMYLRLALDRFFVRYGRYPDLAKDGFSFLAPAMEQVTSQPVPVDPSGFSPESRPEHWRYLQGFYYSVDGEPQIVGAPAGRPHLTLLRVNVQVPGGNNWPMNPRSQLWLSTEQCFLNRTAATVGQPVLRLTIDD